MANIISQISSWALSVIDKTGYVGVFILSALESAAIPIPSEIVVPFAGFLASSGRFGFWSVVMIATLANLVGAIFLYLISRGGFRWVLEKYGKYFFVQAKDLERADDWFAKHGATAVFFSRMLPIIRTFIPLSAGVARMNFSKFVILTFLGSLPWNLGLAYVGFKAGNNWTVLHPYFQKLNYIIILVLVVIVVRYIWKHYKNA